MKSSKQIKFLSMERTVPFWSNLQVQQNGGIIDSHVAKSSFLDRVQID